MTSAERRSYVEEIGQEAFDAALRIRDQLVTGGGEGKHQIYLCHRFCELGAVPLDRTLGQVRDYVVSHPDQVLVIVNEDYVNPKDLVAAVKESGLAEYVYKGPIDRSSPTLGEMVSSGHRVVLMAENEAGAAPWYQLAYERLVEETPFTFPPGYLTNPANLPASCEPNRGPERAPLFLINHWVSTDPVPRPSDAEKINAYGPLLERARTCQRIRDHIPNLLAVNFYKRGDLFRVVDTLNGTD